MKTLIVIFAIFVILPFITSGYEVAISNIKSLLSGIWQILRFMAEMALRFPDELGLLDAAYTWILYLILCVLFCCLGIHMSKREKGKLFTITSFVISTLSLFISIAGMGK